MAKSFISAAERELIKSAAACGAEILSLESAPTFRLIPLETVALVNEAPRKRSLSFKRKPHMKAIKNWSPASLTWGAVDARIPMRGDPDSLTRARKAWSNGDPSALRLWLSANQPVRVVSTVAEEQLALLAA